MSRAALLGHVACGHVALYLVVLFVTGSAGWPLPLLESGGGRLLLVLCSGLACFAAMISALLDRVCRRS